jgi:hypothetical protein
MIRGRYAIAGSHERGPASISGFPQRRSEEHLIPRSAWPGIVGAMHSHAPAQPSFSVPGRLWAVVYAGVVVALVFASVAVLAARSHVFGSSDPAAQTIGASAARVLRVGAYELQIASVPTRIGEQTAASVRLVRGGRPLEGARVRITFSMPAMPGMHGLAASLRETAPGVYTNAAPILTVGRWLVRVRVAPSRARSFSAGFTYRVAA